MDDTATETEGKVAMTPEQRALRRVVARAMWGVEVGKTSGDQAEQKAAFGAAKSEYSAKAGKLIRLLERRGAVISLSAAEVAGTDDDSDDE